MKAKRKTTKTTTTATTATPRNVTASGPGARGSKLTRKLVNEGPKPDYQGPKFSSAHNPLIDDLLGELGTSIASEEMPNLSLDNSDNGNELGGHYSEYLSKKIPSQSSDSCSSGKFSKMAMDAVTKASQCFVHTLTKYGLKSYLSSSTGAAKEVELRRLLHSKGQNDLDNFVLALLEIIEDIYAVHIRLKSSTHSLTEHCQKQENDMSGSLISVMSTASLMRPPVHETNKLAVAFDQKGHHTINRYVVVANLGEGSYGKVKLAEEMDSGKKVAIKIIDKQFLQKKFGSGNSGGTGVENNLMREITIMKKVRHRNCVSLYEVIDDPASHKLYLIMDYVPNGPVVHLRHNRLMPAMLLATEANNKVNDIRYNKYLIRCSIRHNTDGDQPLTNEEIHSEPSIYSCKPLKETTCAHYLRQLVSGLRYMHDRNVVHHDVKPDNILLGYNGRVYLTDFGVSEILAPHLAPSNEFDLKREASKSMAPDASMPSTEKVSFHTATAARFGGGTLLFTAPELLDPNADVANINPYITDIWALGITLHCMLIGVVPFGGSYYRDLCEHIRTCAHPWNGYNIENQSVLPEWNTILSGLLEKDPQKRWGLKQLKKFLDSEEFQWKLRERAELDVDALRESRRTSAVNPNSPSKVFTANSLSDPAQTAPGENAPKGSGFCRSTGIRRECMCEVARSDGIEVMTRPMKQVSEKTQKIVRKYVESIRSRTLGKNMYFKSSSVFPTSEGGITDSIMSGKVSEDLLKMHNLSATENRSLVMRSDGSSSERLSRSGNVHAREATHDYRKKTHSITAGSSQTQPSLIPVTKRNSRAVYSGAFQSIDAILSIVNVQSESFRSSSFSFVSLCEAGSQKSLTYKTIATPSSALDTTQKCLPEPENRSVRRGSGFAHPLNLSQSLSIDSQAATLCGPQVLGDDPCVGVELPADSKKRTTMESADKLEIRKGSSISVSSLFYPKPDIGLTNEANFMAIDISPACTNKNTTKKIQNGKHLTTTVDSYEKGGSIEQKALNEGNAETKQIRVSENLMGIKAPRSSKDSRRAEREERLLDAKNDSLQQLAPAKNELPNILVRR